MRKLSPDMESMMQARFGKDSVLALATMADGQPHVRYVDAFYHDGAFYVLTHALSGKMRQIGQNQQVAIAGEWFTAHGTGINLGSFGKKENAALAARMKEVFAAWIDNGHSDLTDENTCILCIRLTDGVLFSHGARYEFVFSE